MHRGGSADPGKQLAHRSFRAKRGDINAAALEAGNGAGGVNGVDVASSYLAVDTMIGIGDTRIRVPGRVLTLDPSRRETDRKPAGTGAR